MFSSHYLKVFFTDGINEEIEKYRECLESIEGDIEKINDSLAGLDDYVEQKIKNDITHMIDSSFKKYNELIRLNKIEYKNLIRDNRERFEMYRGNFLININTIMFLSFSYMKAFLGRLEEYCKNIEVNFEEITEMISDLVGEEDKKKFKKIVSRDLTNEEKLLNIIIFLIDNYPDVLIQSPMYCRKVENPFIIKGQQDSEKKELSVLKDEILLLWKDLNSFKKINQDEIKQAVYIFDECYLNLTEQGKILDGMFSIIKQKLPTILPEIKRQRERDEERGVQHEEEGYEVKEFIPYFYCDEILDIKERIESVKSYILRIKNIIDDPRLQENADNLITNIYDYRYFLFEMLNKNEEIRKNDYSDEMLYYTSVVDFTVKIMILHFFYIKNLLNSSECQKIMQSIKLKRFLKDTIVEKAIDETEEIDQKKIITLIVSNKINSVPDQEYFEEKLSQQKDVKESLKYAINYLSLRMRSILNGGEIGDYNIQFSQEESDAIQLLLQLQNYSDKKFKNNYPGKTGLLSFSTAIIGIATGLTGYHVIERFFGKTGKEKFLFRKLFSRNSIIAGVAGGALFSFIKYRFPKKNTSRVINQ